MASSRVTLVLAAATLPAVAACSAFESCTLEARAGVVVVVRDSATGATPDTAGAIVTASEGSFQDTAELGFADGSGGIQYQLAYERPGRYLVRVEVPATGCGSAAASG